jgi:hypothetical protein
LAGIDKDADAGIETRHLETRISTTRITHVDVPPNCDHHRRDRRHGAGNGRAHGS